MKTSGGTSASQGAAAACWRKALWPMSTPCPRAAERSEKETRAKAAAAASAFLCPITQTAMADPVLAMDGHTYERAAIERWFANGRATSPVTNARLASTMLVPNHALKSARAAFEEVRGEAAGEDALNDRRTG